MNLSMTDYQGLYELVEERLYPFVQQMVGLLGIGSIAEPESSSSCLVVTNVDDKLETSAENTPTHLLIARKPTGKNGSPLGGSKPSSEGSNGSRTEDLSTCSASEDYYQNGSGSSSSTSEKLGQLQVNVVYDSIQMVLTLKVLRATELAAKDFTGTSDPYVKIMLLPDKKNKLTTNIKRKNLNPRWNETFIFEGFPYTKLLNRTLYLQVLDYDRFSRDDPIGEVCLPLCELDLSSTGQTLWKTLQPCKGHAGKLGELLLTLNYQASVGVICVGVIKARELKAKDINGLSDPYVKIWIMHDGKKIEKKKTVVKEKTLNPVFEETIMFTVPYERIRQTSLVVSVMDYDRMGRNEPIGQIVLGSKSGPMEVKHWNEMFAKSKTDVAKWHILKDFG